MDDEACAEIRSASAGGAYFLLHPNNPIPAVKLLPAYLYFWGKLDSQSQISPQPLSHDTWNIELDNRVLLLILSLRQKTPCFAPNLGNQGKGSRQKIKRPVSQWA